MRPRMFRLRTEGERLSAEVRENETLDTASGLGVKDKPGERSYSLSTSETEITSDVGEDLETVIEERLVKIGFFSFAWKRTSEA
jgi:hypothetical protein